MKPHPDTDSPAAAADSDDGSAQICAPRPLTIAQAAASMGVSPRMVNLAMKLSREGVPDLVRLVESGGLTINAALKVAKLPQGQQQSLVDQGLNAVKASLKSQKTELGEQGLAKMMGSACRDIEAIKLRIESWRLNPESHLIDFEAVVNHLELARHHLRAKADQESHPN
jgi:hypothetical protein